MLLTIVITTYNRCNLVRNAIRSALAFSREMGKAEIIIVDDASSDNTVEMINEEFRSQLDGREISLVSLSKNLGVTGAKNAGVVKASADWVMFFDSDDQLIQESAREVVSVLMRANKEPVLFFRAMNFHNKLVGEAQEAEYHLDLDRFLMQGTPGECLPVVRRSVFVEYPYDEDLRGHEGLAYARMIRAKGPALVSSVVARLYRDEGDDRLSSKTQIKRRSCGLAKGYLRFFKEFYREMNFRIKLAVWARICFHGCRCRIF